jgi:hypothetical protein
MTDEDRYKDVSTTEVLLALLDKSESWLDRMTRYAGWTFFLLLMFVFLLSITIGYGITALGGAYDVATWIGIVLEILTWTVLAVYWFVYYKIKGENDLWKARIRELKRREEVFLMER